VSSIRLEGGQELSLTITKRQNEESGADFLVQFGYRETNWGRVVRLWWQRLRLSRSPRTFWDAARIPILAGSVLVICLVGYVAYLRRHR
jgi:hypothetical protein